jgi:hypothetical protein
MMDLNWMRKKKENKDYKGFVGNPKKYDLIGNIIFRLLQKCGLKKQHYLLDVGAGSLRVGKDLIPWLWKNRYHGVEPQRWLFELGLAQIEESLDEKNPCSLPSDKFNFEIFEKKFDFVLIANLFYFLPKLQIELCLNELKKVIKKDTKILLNFIPGPKDFEGKKTYYPQIVKYTKKYIESLLTDFDIEYIPIKYPGPQVFILAKLKDESEEN